MRFAVSRGWLRPSVQKAVWYYAFETPSAKVMKSVSIEESDEKSLWGWPCKILEPKFGVNIRVVMERKMVNACVQCVRAQVWDDDDCRDYGDYCGRCRSIPVIEEFDDSTALCGEDYNPFTPEASPRKLYLTYLERQTCPNCKTVIHNDAYAVFTSTDAGWSCYLCDVG